MGGPAHAVRIEVMEIGGDIHTISPGGTMSTVEQPAVDVDKLPAFVFRGVEEVGATLNAALVVMGDRLGLYRGLAGTGGLTSAQLASATGTAERYVREW